MGQALDAALQALTIDSLHEASHRHVMRLHLRMGNRVAALQQYEACQAILLEELGVAPDARTRALREQALRKTAVSFRVDQRLPSGTGREPIVFVGRQREMAAPDVVWALLWMVSD